jgi:Skp family chaperone for outer membrane proteins
MLKDESYDKVKLLHELSHVLNFLKKHALPEVEQKNQPLTEKLYQELAEDLDKHVEKLRQAVEGLAREGKF